MTHDLPTLLAEHVRAHEPATSLAVDDVFRAGRRRRRVRRLGGGHPAAAHDSTPKLVPGHTTRLTIPSPAPP
ncbi:MAG: hypothetical protein ACTHKG_12925, partial [Nocardioides sp.]